MNFGKELMSIDARLNFGLPEDVEPNREVNMVGLKGSVGGEGHGKVGSLKEKARQGHVMLSFHSTSPQPNLVSSPDILELTGSSNGVLC